jgi:radical SAM superfamily enzyme YgiQ (UPF0313 family)
MTADISLVAPTLEFSAVSHDSLLRKKSSIFSGYPLGPLCLISVLEKAGYRAEYKESGADIKAFAGDSADIIGISSTSFNLPYALVFADKLKKLYPNKIIILGNIGASHRPTEILKNFPCINLIVIGEGEQTIVEVMDILTRGKSLCNVKGIAYKEENKIIVTPGRPLIEDLSSLPYPAYDKLAKSGELSSASIMTMRGCPFQCTFCSVRRYWGNCVREYSIDYIIGLIEYLKDNYHISSIEIIDDTFTTRKKRVYEFCKRLKRERLDISWGASPKISTLDEELMQVMASSNCKGIFVGVESGSNRVLKIMRKGHRIEEAICTISKATKYFESILASFMWLLPFETKEEIIDTIIAREQIKRCGKNVHTEFNQFVLLPFSSLYDEYKDQLIRPKKGITPESGGVSLSKKASLYLEDKKLWKEISNLVQKYPSLFPNYYLVRGDNFSAKYSVVLTYLPIVEPGLADFLGLPIKQRPESVYLDDSKDLNPLEVEFIPNVREDVITRVVAGKYYLVSIRTADIYEINKSLYSIWHICKEHGGEKLEETSKSLYRGDISFTLEEFRKGVKVLAKYGVIEVTP